MKLTDKQIEMVDYIRDYIKKTGMAPNAAEAAKHMDKSRQSCSDMMNKLKEIGVLDYNRYGIRLLRIVGDGTEPVPVNLPSPVLETRKTRKISPLSDTETDQVVFKSKWLCMPLRA